MHAGTHQKDQHLSVGFIALKTAFADTRQTVGGVGLTGDRSGRYTSQGPPRAADPCAQAHGTPTPRLLRAGDRLPRLLRGIDLVELPDAEQ